MPPRPHHHHPGRAGPGRGGRGRGSLVGLVAGAGTPKRVIELVCPTGVAPGQIIEVTFEGHQFYATVPQNVAPGATFRIEVELPAPVAAATLVRPVAPPPPPLPAAIVSDRHGEWHRAAYPGGVASAERPWRGLGVTHASVMFVRDGATWTVAKSYGLPGAIAAIEKRFHEEFVHELFPQSPLVRVQSSLPLFRTCPRPSQAHRRHRRTQRPTHPQRLFPMRTRFE